jgi:hypothetical protein
MSLEYTEHCGEYSTSFYITGIRSRETVIPYSEYMGNDGDHFECPGCGIILRPIFDSSTVAKSSVGFFGFDIFTPDPTYIPVLTSFKIIDLRQEFMYRHPQVAIARELSEIREILKHTRLGIS